MKNFFNKHHSACMNTILVLSIVILLGLSILFTFLVQKNVAYGDLTPEKLYTLSSTMVDTCGALKGDITITFCADPDQLMANRDTRYVYVMCKELDVLYDNIHVETYNIIQNPTAVNKYRPTSATRILASDMIVSCGNRYRITSCSAFWTLAESETNTSNYYSFNGEYKLASILMSVTSVVDPVVCVTYGHGEKIYVPESANVDDSIRALSDENYRSFFELLVSEGLTVKYINLDAEEIPDDCILLVMNGPTEDYSIGDIQSISSVTPIKKMHSFLADNFRSMLLFKDPTVTLPNIEDFSEDWGVAFDNGIYVREDANHALSDGTGTNQKVIAALSDDEYSTAHNIYSAIVSLATAPKTIVENTGTVHQSWINPIIPTSTTQNYNAYYYDFLFSSDKSMAYTTDGLLNTDKAQSYSLAAITFRRLQNTKDDTQSYSYFFAAATTELTSNTYLGNMSYGNYDVLYATIRYISRTDEYASIALGGTSLNSPTPGGKVLVLEKLADNGTAKFDNEGNLAGYYDAVTSRVQLSSVIVLVLIPLILLGTTGTILLTRRKHR